MQPMRVYPKDLTADGLQAALLTNGLGLLTCCKEAACHRVINGDWSVSLTYPADAPGAELLEAENLICVDLGMGGTPQLYRVARRKPKTTREGRVIEIEAPHVAYDLRHKYVVNIETKEDERYPDGIDASTALTQLLEGTGFAAGDVTVDGSTLDYLDVLQKDVMTVLKEQLLDKWGGEIAYDNFTLHLRSALGTDRRYPIRDGRNIAEITVTENMEPVITRLHVRGYDGANFEDLNDGKDYLDSTYIGGYSHIREGYVDFSDDDQAQVLLDKGRKELAKHELPEITYDVRLADMRGSVQYALYQQLERFDLGDTAMVHTWAVNADVIVRCTELETDCLTGRNLTVTLGNQDAEVLAAMTSGASAAQKLSGVLTANGHLQAEKVEGKLDLVRITNLVAEISRLAKAEIGNATIQTAQIHELASEVARIANACIDSATIQAAQIDQLAAVIATAIHQEAQVGTFKLAEVQNLLAQALVLQKGTADSMMITNLSVTSANLLSATLGELVLKGTDGKYYQVAVGSGGTLSAQETAVSADEIAAGCTSEGNALVDTGQNVAALNAQSVKAQEAVLGSIIAGALSAGKITAGEALIASATIPTLYAASIQAIGSSLDLVAVGTGAPPAPDTDKLWMDTSVQPQQLKRWDGTAWVPTGADPDTYFSKTETTAKLSLLNEKIQSTVSGMETLTDALDSKADAQTLEELTTSVAQTARELTVAISRTSALEGGQAAADELLTQYRLTFRIDAGGVTIGKSDSDFDLHMDNTQLQFRQAGEVIAYISNNKLYIASSEVTSSLQIASYVWRRMKDGSLGLMYEG